MRVLVTGAAGFIGSNLCLHLARRHEVLAVDIAVSPVLMTAGVPHVICDIQSPNLSHFMRDYEAVVHLAAVSGVADSIADPQGTSNVNVMGTVAVLEAARRVGIRRLLFASTAGAILGHSVGAGREESPARPLSPYGAAKLAGEAFCRVYDACYGLPTLALRFSNVYGPGSAHKKSAVASFLRAALERRPLVVYGDGEQSRDFIYVGDLCTGIEQALMAAVGVGVCNLASGTSVSINGLVEYVRIVMREHGVSVEVEHEQAKPGEVRSSRVDISKARALLGFNPKKSLLDGLRQTVSSVARSLETNQD